MTQDRISKDDLGGPQAAPPNVIRGADQQPPSSVGIDWLRLTLPRNTFQRVQALFGRLFGEASPGKGMWFYEFSIRYAAGPMILANDEGHGDYFSVEVQGEALGMMTGSPLDLLRQLVDLGGKATRLDVRVDYYGEDLPLLGQVVRSCEAGELCRARRWSNQETRDNRGVLLGQTVYLGRRGKDGSGRFVRIYDKGLESGSAPAGEWVRWEAEFAGEVAGQVAESLVADEEPSEAMRAYALGAVEFREVPDGAGQMANVSRRDLVGWYARLLGETQPARHTVPRDDTTLESYVAWLRRCVAPSLASLAVASGEEIHEVWTRLVGEDVEPWADLFCRTVVWEWMRERYPEVQELEARGLSQALGEGGPDHVGM